MPLLIILFSVIILLMLSLKIISPFVGLVVVSVFAGLAMGMQTETLVKSIEKGVGDTLGNLALIFCLGAMLGKLSQDHAHAQAIADTLKGKDFVKDILPVETNIIIFEIKGRLTPKDFVQKMNEENIKMFAMSSTHVRMVTHLGITSEMVDKTVEVINSL